MGSILEINDSLQLTTGQGFPVEIFNLERHRTNPITLAEVGDRLFRFEGKPGPRFFHLDPVRVFWFHNLEGRWLAWGHVVIQEQTISRNPAASSHGSAINISDPGQWVTSGTYRVAQVYDPEYQRAFTLNDLPAELAYGFPPPASPTIADSEQRLPGRARTPGAKRLR